MCLESCIGSPSILLRFNLCYWHTLTTHFAIIAPLQILNGWAWLTCYITLWVKYEKIEYLLY